MPVACSAVALLFHLNRELLPLQAVVLGLVDKSEVPTKKSLRIEDKVNSHSIFSKLCFPNVPVPSDD
jgi:hypothetical protein